ncbi:3-isopropylmalate dehydratase large subunit [Ramlibacter sp. AW1]|uniref:3-isopropylmalate dehydratase n=1 Tax=Ramlibacter aurantiacus TaxID=2801330 RepID=A0A936ZIQ5_9BURK|nr:3-isopropylmalate dehydratase large subunit [Ramlibacter aurantiacus]MBL0421647.1 3-isopropylmalate dehydratase large subunit [Ramlibacter aurantiacus]
MSTEGTLFEKLWQRHVVAELGDGFALLHVDRHVVPDFNGNAFTHLRRRGLKVRNPELTFASADHSVSTEPQLADPTQQGNPHVAQLRADTREFGVRLFDIGQPGHGIVHVIAPEMGLVLPGLTVAIGDSHTCTHGAMGALAWGVGQGELLHILATQTCMQRKPRTMRVNLQGRLPDHTSAKDLVLHLIGQLGVSAGNGFAVEYAGEAVCALPMEGRFTLCNMSVEWGARYGLVAPDDTTFEWLAGRPYAPSGAAWDAALADWRQLAGDADARFDREVTLDVSRLVPQVTWGNSLDMVLPVDGRIPDPAQEPDPARRASLQASLDYMGLRPGQALQGLPVQRVFIGSCTNSRLEDLRTAAAVVRGRRVAPAVTAWVVPGSENVRRQAEAEGLDRVFTDAGFQWRRPGCSMCLSANGDTIGPGERAVSTANRNFAGRQGPGSRTHLASPALAAASACAGHITHPARLPEVAA